MYIVYIYNQCILLTLIQYVYNLCRLYMFILYIYSTYNKYMFIYYVDVFKWIVGESSPLLPTE